MKSSKILVIVVLIFLGWIFGLYLIKKRINNTMGFNDDFFKKVANVYYEDSFSGVVTKKYIDSTQHNFKKVVLKNNFDKERQVRLDYEWFELFKFIKVGDSVSKKKNSLDMNLRRNQIDTMIRLNFSNIKNSYDYIDFLYELDSIYDN